MIDIHTHILPCIDDGSQSVEESLEMLTIMKNSGVKKVVATPHFYSDNISLDEFLENRREAYNKIEDVKPDGIDIILGAEVLLTFDIHKEELRKLAIEGTDYILVEMPYARWDPWVYDEIFKISARHELEIIVAHIDRYVGLVPDECIKRLFEMELKFQVNLDFLGNAFKTSPAIKILKSNDVHFIASDCHNLTTRKPCLADGIKKINARVGRKCTECCMTNAEKMLENKSI